MDSSALPASFSLCDFTAFLAAVYLAIYVIFVHESTERRHLRFAQAVLADHAVHLEDEAASLRVQTRQFAFKQARLSSSVEVLQKKLQAAEKQVVLEKKQRLSREGILSKLAGDIDTVSSHIRLVSRDLRQQKKHTAKLEAYVESFQNDLKSRGVDESIISDLASSTKSETSCDHPSEDSPASSVSYVTNSSPTETADSDSRARSSDSVHTPKKETTISSSAANQGVNSHSSPFASRGITLSGLRASFSPATPRTIIFPTELSKSPV